MAAALNPCDTDLSFLHNPELVNKVWDKIADEIITLHPSGNNKKGEICSQVSKQSAIIACDEYRVFCKANLGIWRNQAFNILCFMREHTSSFPKVCRVFRAIGAVQATAVDCERSFSGAGTLFSEKRRAMEPETLESLCFIRGNVGKDISLKKIVETAQHYALEKNVDLEEDEVEDIQGRKTTFKV
jgi:hypothetical protein